MPILGRLTRRTAGDLAVEVILIILGITCALWFDGAKDGRDERALEQSLLREMARTLESDTTDFRIAVDGLARVSTAVDTVVRYLTERREYRPELDEPFAAAFFAYGIFPNRAAYEDLRSAGLPVIRSDSLRQNIVQYYDFTIPAARILEEMRVFPFRIDLLLPHVTEKFAISGDDVRFREGGMPRATPRDYSSLQDDVEFLNVLRLWRQEIRLQARWTEGAYLGAKSLLDAIEAELAPG